MEMKVSAIALLAALSMCSIEDEGYKNGETSQKLSAGDGLHLVYNSEGLFIGELDHQSNVNDIVSKFGYPRVPSVVDDCIDYGIISWRSKTKEDTFKCGNYSFKLLKRKNEYSYSAHSVCSGNIEECTAGLLSTGSFQIEVEDGQLTGVAFLGESGEVLSSFK